ncbi:MAG: hypothetical protein WED10_12785 [Brumimicrobium sp.]
MPKSSLVCFFVFIGTFSFSQKDTLKQEKLVNIFGYPELHSVDSFTTVSKTDNRLVGKWILKKMKIYSEGELTKEFDYDLSVEKEGFLLKTQFQGGFIHKSDTIDGVFYWCVGSKKDTLNLFHSEYQDTNIDYRITPSFAFKIEKIRRNQLILSVRKLRHTTRSKDQRVYKKEIYIYRRIRKEK